MRAAAIILALAVNAHAATASWYGQECAGLPMADGRPFDPAAMTCASWSYPLGTRLVVATARGSVTVTVTDRGPARRLRRDIDLSEAAFARVADLRRGVAAVTLHRELTRAPSPRQNAARPKTNTRHR